MEREKLSRVANSSQTEIFEATQTTQEIYRTLLQLESLALQLEKADILVKIPVEGTSFCKFYKPD